MNCPICGKKCRTGIVQARDKGGGPIQIKAELRWFPKEYEDKFFKKDVVKLQLTSPGFYCESCKKIFVVYDA